ncbi:MAG: hypothetical protein KAS70_03050 [Planctomycetes bacterium]|nr:hypothetical protein [Planctomycetota bacterium]
MNNKALYLIIGVLVGIIGVLLLLKSTPRSLIAEGDPAPSPATPANITTGSANEIIALTTNTKTGTTILWLIDTENKKMIVYEYADENYIRLVALRDIQYDLNIPAGVAFPAKRATSRYMTPHSVKGKLDKIRAELEKRKGKK